MLTAANETITVLTLHVRERKETIIKCVQSVAAQTVNADVLHVIIIDGQPDEQLDQHLHILSQKVGIKIDYIQDISSSLYPKQRLVKLREVPLQNVSSKWLAWLDDDNWWEPSHLQTLLDLSLQNPQKIAHSYRRLWTWDGRPYNIPGNPWQSEPDKEARHTAYLEKLNIRRNGEPLMRDAIYPEPLDGYYGCIDLGAWLFPTTLAQQLGLSVPDEGDFGEDDILLAKIIQSKLKVQTTGKFTLNYRIGGTTSNA